MRRVFSSSEMSEGIMNGEAVADSVRRPGLRQRRTSCVLHCLAS